MQRTGASFGHEDRRRIYEHVERRGAVEPGAVRQALGVDRRGFRHHVAILRRDGRLATDDRGRLHVVIADGEAETHRADGVPVTIRPARQDDLSGLVGAIRQVAEDGEYIVAESVADLLDHEEVLYRHNEVESRVFFVATAGGTGSAAGGDSAAADPHEEVVGWVHLRGPELEKLAHTAELTVGVLEEYRGHGVGSHLLARGVEWAADAGYVKLYQSLPATNGDAVAFLEAHGWSVEAVREDHYRIDDDYVDEVMLATWL